MDWKCEGCCALADGRAIRTVGRIALLLGSRQQYAMGGYVLPEMLTVLTSLAMNAGMGKVWLLNWYSSLLHYQ